MFSFQSFILPDSRPSLKLPHANQPKWHRNPNCKMHIPAPAAAFVQTLLATSTPCPTHHFSDTHTHMLINTYETRFLVIHWNSKVQEQHHPLKLDSSISPQTLVCRSIAKLLNARHFLVHITPARGIHEICTDISLIMHESFQVIISIHSYIPPHASMKASRTRKFQPFQWSNYAHVSSKYCYWK